MKNFKSRNNDRSKSYDKRPDYKNNKQKSYSPKYESNSYEKKSYGPSSTQAMHAATCSECEDACEVPFRPSGDKPVFCANCFAQKRLPGRSEQADRRPNRDFGKLKSKRDTPSSTNVRSVDHSEEIKILRTEISTLHSKLESITIMIEELKTRELKVVELKDEVKKPAKKAAVKEMKTKEVAEQPKKKVAKKKVPAKAPAAKKVAAKKSVAKKGK